MLHQRVNVLFKSPLAALHNFDCSAPQGDFGHLEMARAFELVFVRRGVFEKRSSRQNIVAGPNRMVVFAPGESYGISHPVQGGDCCTIVTPSAAFLREIAAEVHSTQAAIDSILREASMWSSDRIDLTQRCLVRLLQATDYDSLEVETMVGELIFAVLRQIGGSENVDDYSSDQGTSLARDTEALLIQNYTDNITLNELATLLDTSPFKISRSFNRYAGMSIANYRLRLRVRAAIERLLNGEPDLTRLAHDLGFHDHSHLTHSIRKHIHMTPRALRDGSVDIVALRRLCRRFGAGVEYLSYRLDPGPRNIRVLD